MIALAWPEISPHDDPESMKKAAPNLVISIQRCEECGKKLSHLSLPSPPTMIRFDSPSQARSLIFPPKGLIASLSEFSGCVTSQIRTFPATSAEAQ